MRVRAMVKFIFVSVFCAILTIATYANPTGRIVGGTDASDGQFPHQISLRLGKSHYCGGSIISRRYILTAAHCVGYDNGDGTFTTFPASAFEIRAGSTEHLSGGVLMGVENVTAHENYGNWLNDVALLKLKEPLIFSDHIQAIPLATDEVPAGKPVVISGWGLLKHGGYMPSKLQWNTLTAISREECKSQINMDSDLLLCLAHEINNGACNGDSGGPAEYGGKLVGVANFVYGGCGNIYADGYLKVLPQIDWIKQHTDL